MNGDWSFKFSSWTGGRGVSLTAIIIIKLKISLEIEGYVGINL